MTRPPERIATDIAIARRDLDDVRKSIAKLETLAIRLTREINALHWELFKND